jgi:[ribosomal protein S5]-alanine N-acetyltransferase
MILIRDVKEEDAKTIALLLNNANVAKYLTSKIPYPYRIEDATWWVTTGSKEGINKAIEHDGNFVGAIGVTPGQFENQRSAEIGYWLGEPYWGQGLATEALSKMTKIIFSTTDIVRLFAPVFEPNSASKRVLEKCGYYQESVQKKALFKHGQLYDACVFAKLNS